MLRLATVLYAMVGTTMAGIMIVIALVSGYDTLNYIVISAAIGAIAAIPTVYLIAKAITANE